MRTYFIRHGASANLGDELRTRLWQGYLFGIHYPTYDPHKQVWTENESTSHTNYTGSGKTAVRLLEEIGALGGYVCADHAGFGCIVGRVPPNTEVKILRSDSRKDGAEIVLKTLQMEQNTAQKLTHEKASRLLIGRPRQGTIARWARVGERVKKYVEEGGVYIQEIDDLLPLEQEIMCSEFMRLPAVSDHGLPILIHLTAPVGGTRKAVDFSGIDHQGAPIFAQVTNRSRSSAKQKHDALRAIRTSSKTHLIYFCRCETPIIEDGVTFFPIQTVFDEMRKLKSGCAMLRIGSKVV